MAFGQLEKTSSAAPMADINMTPLIDVMLVLLVIFIITAPLLTSSIPLELPKSAAAPSSPVPRVAVIAMTKEGQLFLNDQRQSAQQMAQSLAKIAEQQPQTEIHLRVDETVPYGQVVQVMAWAQQVGLNRIGFITKSSRP